MELLAFVLVITWLLICALFSPTYKSLLLIIIFIFVGFIPQFFPITETTTSIITNSIRIKDGQTITISEPVRLVTTTRSRPYSLESTTTQRIEVIR